MNNTNSMNADSFSFPIFENDKEELVRNLLARLQAAESELRDTKDVLLIFGTEEALGEQVPTGITLTLLGLAQEVVDKLRSAEARAAELQSALERQHAATDTIWNQYHALEAQAAQLREALERVKQMLLLKWEGSLSKAESLVIGKIDAALSAAPVTARLVSPKYLTALEALFEKVRKFPEFDGVSFGDELAAVEAAKKGKQ